MTAFQRRKLRIGSLGALLRARILTSWSPDSQASDSHNASSLSKLLVNGLYIPWNISHRKDKLMSSAATWMDLGIIIRSEISHAEKDKHHMI